MASRRGDHGFPTRLEFVCLVDVRIGSMKGSMLRAAIEMHHQAEDADDKNTKKDTTRMG